MKLFSQTQWNLKNCVIFLDVDGTLVGDAETKLKALALKTFNELKKNNLIFLCSNSVHRGRTEKMAKELGVKCNSGSHKKPHKEVLEDFRFPENKKKVVIGNLHLIDGRFAKNIGAKFYPVKTLLGANDKTWIDRIFYFIDAHLFSKCI